MASPGNSSVITNSPSTPITSTTLPITSTPSNSPSSDVTTTPSSAPSPSTSNAVTSPTSATPPVSSLTPTTPSTTQRPVTSTQLITQTSGGTTLVVTQTSTTNVVETTAASNNPTGTDAAASASSTDPAALQAAGGGDGNSGGLPTSGKIAIAVVIPIVGVALLVFAGLWFWRKRKQRQNAEDLRRKEMEEYGFNPNNDPTLPPVGGSANGDEVSTMRERDAGYRGWGTTSSNTRKASTTLSSNAGMARSDSGGNGYKSHSPTGVTQGSDGHSADPLMGQHGDETVGALGAAPAAGAHRGNINRGPSNASSAYSGGNRSDVSALSDGPLPNGSSPPYAQDYMYPEGDQQNGWDGQPVIRDVSARRNTRIENPSILPQQGNTGISQNF